LEGNPVYDGLVRTFNLIKGDGKRILAINEVVAGDALVCAEVGDAIDTLKTLMSAVQEIYLLQIPQAVDVLRLRVPPPLDGSFYQADKALKNNHLAVRDGGGILLEAECAEGIGLDAFMNLLRRADTYSDVVKHVREQGYCLGDHKAVKLRYLTDSLCRGVHVALMSSHVSPEDAGAAGLRAFAPEDLPSAMKWVLDSMSGPARRGLIVEDAGCAVVRVKPPDR
jgi:hypothetical protein